ncbi:MAG: glycosyltransferase family 87 protein, partial [Amphiplicatus sp.]
LMAQEGRAPLAYDWTAHYAEQQQVFDDPEIEFYGWHYPPFFLLAAALLALLPYTVSWLVWMTATLPLYLASIRAILPEKGALLAAAAFPAVFVNVIHGQNGFLTAALIGAAMLLLDRRPLVAGVLVGLLAYKPQFGVLIPLALIAAGRWRSFAAAVATVLMLIAFSTLVFGPDVWRAFAESGHLTRTVVLESGNTGWEKIQSLFSALRALGAPVGAAYAAQGALFAGVGASLVWLWRSAAAQELKAAGLIVASLLATPYVLDYDLVALGPAIAFLAVLGLRDGFRPYEKTLLALAFFAPVAARPVAAATLIPLGLIVMLALYAFILGRARSMARAASPAAA